MDLGFIQLSITSLYTNADINLISGPESARMSQLQAPLANERMRSTEQEFFFS